MTALNYPITRELLVGAGAAAFRQRARRRLPSASPAAGVQAAPKSRHYVKYLPQISGKPSDTVVAGVGREQYEAGEPYPAPNHPNLYDFKWRTGRVLPEHQLILVTNAYGEFESKATGLVRFQGAALIYLFPGVWHRYRPMENSAWTERWVSLDGPAVREGLTQGEVTPDRAILLPSCVERLSTRFDQLIETVELSHSYCGGAIATEAIDLLAEAIRQTTDVDLGQEGIVASESNEVQDDVVRAALEIIWNDKHSPPLGVSDVARMLPVTRRTLDRRFSEALGRSVLEEINACRFARAQRMLRETDLPIKAVSFLSGFPSRERMRIMFLEREGVPPRDYREQFRADQRS